MKRKIAMPFCVCLLGAVLLSACGAPQGGIKKLDEKFRARIVATLPDDYSSVDPKAMHKKITQIAREVYGPRAADLRTEAHRLLAALPAADKDMTAGYVERSPGKPFVFDDKKPDKAERARAEESHVYRLRLWAPSAAAHFAVTMMLSRSMGPRAFGARLTYEMCVPAEIYRSGGTADAPELIVKSLKDVFIVRLRLIDCGGYIPVDVRWLVKKGK